MDRHVDGAVIRGGYSVTVSVPRGESLRHLAPVVTIYQYIDRPQQAPGSATA